MAKLTDVRLNVTTDGSGDGSATSSESVYGRLYAVVLIDGTYDNNVDLTLSCVNNAEDVADNKLVAANWDSDKILYPRTLQHGDTDGAALTGTAGGDRTMPLVNGKLKLVIAQGGAAKTGGVIAHVLVN